jgi:CHRD domain
LSLDVSPSAADKCAPGGAYVRRRRVFAGVDSAALLAASLFLPSPALAAPHSLSGAMTGSQEVPPETTTGSGVCVASVDDASLTVTFSGSFTGLQAPASAVAIHGLAGAGVVAPALLQTTIAPATHGTFSGSGTLGATTVAGMIAGRTYCEIADSAFPTGEIRGQLIVVAPVTTPSLPPMGVAGLVLLLGGAGAWAAKRRAQADRVATS